MPTSRPLPLLVAFCVALSLCSAAPVASAAPHARLGPFPQRVRHPQYLLHLQPSPLRAAVLTPGSVQVELNMDWSNVYERWSRDRPLGRQISDLDMEIVRLAPSIRVGLPLGFEVGIEVPLLTMTGGVGDRTIQRWHAALNAENGGREDVADDRFAYRLAVPQKLNVRITEPVVMLPGDVTIDGLLQLVRPSTGLPGLAARLALKLPTGSVERGTSSGAPDVAALLLAEHGWRWLSVYGQLGLIALGRTGEIGNVVRPGAVTWSLALELNAGPGLSLVGQFYGHSSFLTGFVHRFTALSPIGVMFGLRGKAGPVEWSLAMEQDILNGDPTADVSLVGTLGFTAGARSGGRDPARRD